ncbi:hypothetical protein N9M15_00095 [Bacteroidia bacterium]|nr:hypothetical protein [Bacteroidia bacterium]
MINLDVEKTTKIKANGNLIRYLILIFWALFWLFNVLDKLVGGAHYLFVGKDRFAQIQRYFDSIGLGNPLVTNFMLMFTTALESFALVCFLGALYHLQRKNIESNRAWFFLGIVVTLTTYTFFSIGDQIFGDHSELLEHALFWFIALLSWIIYHRSNQFNISARFSVSKKSIYLFAAFTIIIGSFTSISIFRHNQIAFKERTQAVQAKRISANKYKIEFPFLAGSSAFERTIAKFKEQHADLRINYIYTAPKPMRLGQSDGLIIYIQTEEK